MVTIVRDRDVIEMSRNLCPAVRIIFAVPVVDRVICGDAPHVVSVTTHIDTLHTIAGCYLAERVALAGSSTKEMRTFSGKDSAVSVDGPDLCVIIRGRTHKGRASLHVPLVGAHIFAGKLVNPVRIHDENHINTMYSIDELTIAATDSDRFERTCDLQPFAIGTITHEDFILIVGHPSSHTHAVNPLTVPCLRNAYPFTMFTCTEPRLTVSFHAPNELTISAVNINHTKGARNFFPIFIRGVVAGKIPDVIRRADTPNVVTMVGDRDMLTVTLDVLPLVVDSYAIFDSVNFLPDFSIDNTDDVVAISTRIDLR